MKKLICVLLAAVFALSLVIPVSAAGDETNFKPFSIKEDVRTTGSANGWKRLVVKTAKFPFSVAVADQLVGCMLNGTVTYTGEGSYSKTVPFSDVKIEKSDVRSGETAIDFAVPSGYSIRLGNEEDAYYTWDLTISPPKAAETDLPENGCTFFIAPAMFKDSMGSWLIESNGGYTVLSSGSSSASEAAAAAVRIPQSGTYGIFSFTKDFAADRPGTRYADIAVNGRQLLPAGKHGQDGYAWEQIGEMTFSEGAVVKVEFLKGTPGYSRTAALMFTTELDYRPATETFQDALIAGAAQTVTLPKAQNAAVTLSATGAGGIKLAQQQGTVPYGLAKSNGYEGLASFDENGSYLFQPTVFDALVYAHKQIYLTYPAVNENLVYDGAKLTKVFGETKEVCAVVNGAFVTIPLEQKALNAGDKVEFYLWSDENKTDCYAGFTQNRTKVQIDKPVPFETEGIFYSAPETAFPVVPPGSDSAALKVLVANGQDLVFQDSGAVVSPSGQVSLTFSDLGTYYIALSGSCEKDGASYPVMSRVCKVEVLETVAENIYNFSPFKLDVSAAGNGTGTIKLVVKKEFGFDVAASNALVGCKVTGTATKKEETASFTRTITQSADRAGDGTKVEIYFEVGSELQAAATDGPAYWDWDVTISPADCPVDLDETNLFIRPEDFQSDLGTWTVQKDGGYTILQGLPGGTTSDASDATALVEIPEDGVYYIWGMAKDFTSNSPGARACKLGINGKGLPGLVGVHGAVTDTGASGAYGWDLAGTATLKKGTVTISLLDVNKNYARVAAVLLTTDRSFQGLQAAEFGAVTQFPATVIDGIFDFSCLSSYGNQLSYTLKNRTDQELTQGTLAAAIYDADGKLVDTQTQILSQPLGAGKSLEKTSLTFQATSEWATGKLMLWDGLDTARPLRQEQSFVFTPEDYANPDDDAGKDFGTVTSYMLDYTFTNPDYSGKEYNTRGGIYNTLKKLKDGEDVTIAYLGGSITQQNTWRPKTTQWFEENYAGKVTEVNIGLSGTNADLAVCRIDQDILVHNPDLIFIEYAVNGGAAKDMEGMVLKIWEKDPTTDICFVYTTTTNNYSIYKSGQLPSFAKIYEEVAQAYDIPAVFFAYQPFDLYEQGKLTLSAKTPEPGKVLYTTDGIHPTTDGGWLAAGAIARAVAAMEKEFDSAAYTIQNHSLPPQTLVTYPWKDANYCEDWSLMKFDGTWMDCSLNKGTNEFQNFAYTGGYLDTFKTLFPKMRGTKVPGSSVTVKFKGTDLGVFEAGGQFSGQLRVIIDGVEQTKKMILYNNNDSKLRHQYYFIPTQAYGEHTVTFILDETMPDKSELQNKYPTDLLYQKNEFYLGKILVVGEVLDMNASAN